MANAITLNAEIREITGRKIRRENNRKIPAVLYGHGVKNKNVWVNAAEFMRVFKETGESTVVKLNLEGVDRNVLIHDYQLDPILNEIIHVDFFEVKMDEVVTADIAINIVGESPAVKNMGGILTHIDFLSVRALPGDLPHEFDIDISVLKDFDSVITVNDLDVSDKVEVLANKEQVIASVSAPRTQARDDNETDEDVSSAREDDE